MVTTTTQEDKKIKSFPAFITETKQEGDLGIVSAFVAIMGNIDHHMEVIVNGAFKKTINERWQKIRVLDNHNYFSAEDAIAKLLVIREVLKDELPPQLLEKYPDATGGLYVECQFMIDEPTDKSATIFRRIKRGLIDEYSIGFRIIKSEWRTVNTDAGEKEVLFILEIKLYEISPVIFAANDATMTVDAKGDKSEPVTLNFQLENVLGKSSDEITNLLKQELCGLGFIEQVENGTDNKADETEMEQKAIPSYELAPADEMCGNCKFYRAVTDKNGYCTYWDEAVNMRYICDDYERAKELQTIGNILRTNLTEFMNKQVALIMTYGVIDEEDETRLHELLPPLIDNILDLMPQDIIGREIPDEEYTMPKSEKSEAESDDDSSLTSVDENKQWLIENQRRVTDLRKKRLLELSGG